MTTTSEKLHFVDPPSISTVEYISVYDMINIFGYGAKYIFESIDVSNGTMDMIGDKGRAFKIRIARRMDKCVMASCDNGCIGVGRPSDKLMVIIRGLRDVAAGSMDGPIFVDYWFVDDKNICMRFKLGYPSRSHIDFNAKAVFINGY